MIPKTITLRDVGRLVNEQKILKPLFRQLPNRVSWSQFGEDLQVIDLFRSTVEVSAPGFYVDIGAFHPVTLSNTFSLYLQGWKGINIDAMNESTNLFTQIRPLDISLPYVIRNYDGETDFYVGETFFGESSIFPDWRAGSTKKRVLPCRTLDSILEEFLPEDTHIDFMSIDVEGAENELFEGFHLEHYKPSILAIEIKVDSIEELLSHPLYNVLCDAGYIYRSQCGPTSIFVSSEKLILRTVQEQHELLLQYPKY